MLIDTHAHLYLEHFSEDLSEVVERAKNHGLEKILLPNIDVESVAPLLKLCDDYQNFFYPMMGLHPCSVDKNFEAQLNAIWQKMHDQPIVAVGEIGIDLYWDKATLDLQREAFRVQVAWAKKLKLPIVIHARDSYDELFQELDLLNNESLSGVFHCFTGSVEQGAKILEYGNFYLGLGGVVTFKKSGLDETLKCLPLDKLIVETDAPYLAPTPFRGKRNESYYLSYVVNKLAEIYDKSSEEIARATSDNAKNLFDRIKDVKASAESRINTD